MNRATKTVFAPWRSNRCERSGGRREFKRGIVHCAGDRWHVRTTGPQGSGILTSMTQANCLIVVDEDAGDVAAGDLVWVEPFGLP